MIMRNDILSPFENLPYFTIAGFRQVAGKTVSGGHYARVTLSRRVRSGQILRLKKGVYMHRRFYERHRQSPPFSMIVSAILLPQSYLSLEYVLQQHNLLTEITYPVTAITPKNTRTLTNDLGTFVYRHIQSKLYRGFQLQEAYRVSYALASSAKALFDYFYLHPFPAGQLAATVNLAEELRLNLDDFTLQERDEFAGYVALSGKPKMQRILTNLENFVWQP